jgi:nucleotide-binding universal stress UspA family protein
MKPYTILFPTDFSPQSQTALELATSLARERNATLLIVHAQEPPMPFGGGEFYYSQTEFEDKRALQLLKTIVPANPTVPFEHRLVQGDPADAILKLADEEQVDLIVMPTHGRTGLLRLLMGSVAEAVVRQADCPVLTVKGAVPAAANAPA